MTILFSSFSSEVRSEVCSEADMWVDAGDSMGCKVGSWSRQHLRSLPMIILTLTLACKCWTDYDGSGSLRKSTVTLGGHNLAVHLVEGVDAFFLFHAIASAVITAGMEVFLND